MRSTFRTLVLTMLAIMATAQMAHSQEVRTKKVEGFGGVIARKYEDSKEWWPKSPRPPEGALPRSRRNSPAFH